MPNLVEVVIRPSRQELCIVFSTKNKPAYSKSSGNALLDCRVLVRSFGEDEYLAEAIKFLHLLSTNIKALAALFRR
jgi:hypothetical protein